MKDRLNVKKLTLLVVTILALITMLIYKYSRDIEHYTIEIKGNSNGNYKQAMELYVNRINKYGGINNKDLNIIFTDNPTKPFYLDLSTSIPKIIDSNESMKVDRRLDINTLNYRLGAVKSDCTRKYHKKTNTRILRVIKGLDIIVESLEHNKPISKHHYFNCKVIPKQRVNTGISMIKLNVIDFKNVVFNADFYIWFKWKGDVNDFDNIEFINTNKPTPLLRDIANTDLTFRELCDSTDIEDNHYRRYRVKGKFNALEVKNYVLGEQNLPIKFRHVRLDTKGVVYVHDESDRGKGLYHHELPKNSSDESLAKYNVLVNDELKINYTMQYITYGSRVKMGGDSNEHISEYVQRYGVKVTSNSFRGLESYINTLVSGIDGKINPINLIIFTLIVFTLLLILSELKSLQHLRGGKKITLWFINFILVMTLLLVLEYIVAYYIFYIKSMGWGAENLQLLDLMMNILQIIVSLVWWVFPAYYINSAIDVFGFCPIEDSTNTQLPKILKAFVYAMVYVLAFIGILAYVVQVTPSSLMATSGVFAIIFAVLSKVDVTNIIAGLGLSFSKVFKLGDWVKIADNEGEIIEMSVRGIKLLTVNNAIVNITNSTVSNSIIKNMGENPFRCKIHLEVVPRNYRYIEDALLEGVHKVVGLSEINKPFIAFLGQGDSAQIFEVYFYINDVSQKGDMINKVWREIWSATEKYNIQMSTPQREHFNFNMDKGD